MVKKMQSSMLKHTVPVRRAGKGESMTDAALFLAGDESSHITGTDIVVDRAWFFEAPYDHRALPSKWSRSWTPRRTLSMALNDFQKHFR